MFAAPPSRAADEPLPEVTDGPIPPPAETPNPSLLARLRLPGMKPERPAGAIPTGISSPGSERAPKVGVKEATIALAGLLGVATLAGAWVVQRRTASRQTLRQPSPYQSDSIAAPLARIAARLIPAELLAPSIADAIMAMSATGAYLTDGPLVVPNKPTEEKETDA